MINSRGWFSAAELVGRPGIPATRRSISRTLATLGADQRRRRQGRGGGWEYHISALPPATQAALLTMNCQNQKEPEAPAATEQEPESEGKSAALWQNFEQRPQTIKDRATERLQMVRAVEQLIDGGLSKGEAVRAVAQQTGVGVSTLKRYRQRTKGVDPGDWLPILAPRLAGRVASAEIPPPAWETFKADYLRLERPAASACYDRLQRVAEKEGWPLPSYATFLRRLREIPHQVRTLARKGQEALKRSYPAQVRDHTVYRALEAVNADGHKFDTFVRFPDGEVCRPVMVAWQDISSGKILSHRVDKTENADMIRLAFGDLAGRFGIPEVAFLDNGRGFASKWMTGQTKTRFRFKIKEEDPQGVLVALGVKVRWATPYHGQAKPIERAFRDLCEYVAKHPSLAGAYTGNAPGNKPANYGSRAVDLAEFMAVLDDEIKRHNARSGRRGQSCRGRSFDEIFNESYTTGPIRKSTREQLRLCLLAAENVTCSRQDASISLHKNRYWSECLAPHAGRKVVVRFDPQDLHGVGHVYHLSGEYIGAAECVQPAGFGDTEAAREHARKRNQYNRKTKELLAIERTMTPQEVAAQLPQAEPEVAPPRTQVIKMVPSPAARWAGEQDAEQDRLQEDRAEPGGMAKLLNALQFDKEEQEKKRQADLLALFESPQ